MSTVSFAMSVSAHAGTVQPRAACNAPGRSVRPSGVPALLVSYKYMKGC